LLNSLTKQVEMVMKLISLIMGAERWLPGSRDDQRGSQAGQWALPGGHTTTTATNT